MRRLLIPLLVLLPFAALAGAPKTVTLAVHNMTCPVCPITVKKALAKVAGVSAVNINFDKKIAVVTYDPDKTRPDALTKATAEAGYPSTLTEVTK